jgi:hypothetical protein
MKPILQTIILLISLVTFSQEKMNGEYCLTFGEGDATCIDFKENNRFDYVVSGCLGISAIGSGNFELKDENLKLIFDKAEQNSKSIIQIAETETQSEKEINLEFEIKDENGIELPANVIRTSDRKHFFFNELNKIFIVDKNSPKAKYRVEFIGYETLEFEIDHKTDKVINIILFPAQAKVISDKEIIMKWKKINDNEFRTGSNSWDRFKKMNK